MKNYIAYAFAYLLFLSVLFSKASAQEITKGGDSSKVFKIAHPDFKLSPYTGMTRQHWKDAALYLLEGAFSYVHHIDDAMKFPKQEGKSYPNSDKQIPTEKLEGLCRTLFMAVPLLKENPNLEIKGIKVGEYYRHNIAKLVDSTSESYIRPRAKNGGPSQNLVEFGALAISLFAAPEVLWTPLTQKQKDALAVTMISYGDGPTVPSNWKFFNIFVLSFFKSQAYPVNEKLLEEYLQKALEHYRGEGWYNDNPAYDYYSMWAFQVYGMIWSEFFGKKHYPEYARQFRENFQPLKENYPLLFSRNGQMIMWGRSISYRFASVSPFPLVGFENDPQTNYGWMRRISSGVMLQFLQHPNFMKDNVPCLGFYGPFEPAIQSYSCRGSIFWCGKIFLGLLVPENNPFWTATENEGVWEKELRKGTVANRFQKGSQILITDYPNIGASEIRAWCKVPVVTAWEKFRGSENYNRLSYNSAFPWQADGEKGEVAMNYVVKNKESKWEALRLFTFKKFEDGVYYRDAELETNSNIRFHLADFPLPNGILRIDQNISSDKAEIRLGHYALPQLTAPIQKETRKVKGYEVQLISNGVYQLAMVSIKGWKLMETLSSQGLHPESSQSTVINVADQFEPSAKEPKLYVTLMLWKKAGETWTDDELVPISKIKGLENGQKIELKMVSGEKKTISF